MDLYEWDVIMKIITSELENKNYEDIYILRDYLNALIETKIEGILFDDEKLESRKDFLTTDISLLIPNMTENQSMQTSILKIFKRNNIYCLIDLLQLTEKEFNKIRYIGDFKLSIIKEYLTNNDLSFGIKLTQAEKARLQIYTYKLKNQQPKESTNDVKVYRLNKPNY